MCLVFLLVSMSFAAVLYVAFELPLAACEKIFFEWLFDLVGRLKRKNNEM